MLSNLSGVYKRAVPEDRHRLLVLLFPRHLIYRDGSLRTNLESKAIALLSGKTQKMKDASLNPEAGVLLGSPNKTIFEPEHFPKLRTHLQELQQYRPLLAGVAT